MPSAQPANMKNNSPVVETQNCMICILQTGDTQDFVQILLIVNVYLLLAGPHNS